MKLKAKFKSRIRKSRLFAYYIAIRLFGTNIRLMMSILVNSLFIAWNTLLSAIYRDVLIFSVSVYYLLLVFMRCLLLRTEKSSRADAEKRAVLCVGVLLLIADAAMGGVVIYSLVKGVKRPYSPLLVIPQLFFSVYCLATAFVRIVHRSSRFSATEISLDAITLAAAFFSVFNMINYLSHVDSFKISVKAALAVGSIALITVFVTAVFLLIKNNAQRRGKE